MAKYSVNIIFYNQLVARQVSKKKSKSYEREQIEQIQFDIQ